MTTTVLLIRHASFDAIGKWLAGRTTGIHLNAEGQMEAEELPRRLASIDIAAIYSSPLERTRETAQPLSKARALPVVICDELTDVDYGDWSGKSFSELDGNPEWRRFNTSRSTAVIPRGEHVAQVRDRMAGAIEAIRRQHKSSTLAIFSHGDPIRAALVHFGGKSLDSIVSFSVDPVSISAVRFSRQKRQILAVNHLASRFTLESQDRSLAQMNFRSAGAS